VFLPTLHSAGWGTLGSYFLEMSFFICKVKTIRIALRAGWCESDLEEDGVPDGSCTGPKYLVFGLKQTKCCKNVYLGYRH
jgi:hypothetical protein